ncbi:hypothetical protein GCM10011391_35500 [Pullulanibacillus camelliae]|uniref:Uncharacterized protein n=1 Tax=Pullulanibacillus camelliae TaxID=1707096 RepID=A0A8J3DYI0_9BACL|nr:hypothetical protein GCM10011391_35500 [Pullulanibacillus camelliae]
MYLAIYFATSFSAHGVVRRTIFINGHPIEAFKTHISNQLDSKDKKHRICYDIQNPRVSTGTYKSIPGVCMKKNKYGMYYDVTIGVF